MKIKLSLSYIALAIIISFTSCTIEKRMYMPGYHMEWRNSKHNPNTNELASKDEFRKLNEQSVMAEFLPEGSGKKSEPAASNTDNSIAGLSNSLLTSKKLNIKNANQIRKKSDFKLFKSAEGCDTIILKNGQGFKVKVLEIGPNEIKYKMCDNLNGPTYTRNRSEIYMVIYPNGTKEMIVSGSSDNRKTNETINSGSVSDIKYDGKKELSIRALISMVSGIIALIILFGVGLFALEAVITFEVALTAVVIALASAIVAIVFGSAALKQIKSNPEKYKGSGMAPAGIICGAIALALSVISLFILWIIYIIESSI